MVFEEVDKKEEWIRLTCTLGDTTKEASIMILGIIQEALENAKGPESLFMD